MIEFVNFGFEPDGQTRVAGVDSWDARDLEKQGYFLVGLVKTSDSDNEEKLRGIYRRASDQTVAESVKAIGEAEAEKKKAKDEIEKMRSELVSVQRALSDALIRADKASDLQASLDRLKMELGNEKFNALVHVDDPEPFV